MRKYWVFIIIALCAMLASSVYGFENKTTTLKNGDSETYEYQTKAPEGGVIYGKIHAHSKTSICKFGCELTLIKTGETITVQPGDQVIIDKGVLKIK